MGTGVGARAQGQGHRGKGTGAREHGHWHDKRAWHGLRLGLGWDRHRNRTQEDWRLGKIRASSMTLSLIS